MKTTIGIILTFISLNIHAQKSVDWRSIEVHQMTSAEYPFDKKYNIDTLYEIGEKFIKIKSGPKSLLDLSVNQLESLKKSFAKLNAAVVYIDFNGFFDKERLANKEYYIVFISKTKSLCRQ